MKNIKIDLFTLKQNRETCSSHLRAFSRTTFPKNPGYFGKLVRAAGPLAQICPGYPGISAEDIVASFFVGANFPKYSRYFGKAVRESQPPTIFSKYSEYFGGHFPEIFQISRQPLSSKYPEYVGKMVWSATIEISGIFRRNCPGFERSRCVF